MKHSASVAAKPLWVSSTWEQNEAQIYTAVFFFCRYRMEANFSWKVWNRAKSIMKYSSCKRIDLARFDDLLSYYKNKGRCRNKQTNKHMLILLLISLFLDLFLEWVL